MADEIKPKKAPAKKDGVDAATVPATKPAKKAAGAAEETTAPVAPLVYPHHRPRPKHPRV